jgi:hypothetical protein
VRSVGALALLAVTSLVTASATAAPLKANRSALDPSSFQELSSGITLIRTFTCSGVPTGEGTGFLVGSRVVMTARHVTHGACRTKVYVDNKWMSVAGVTSWSSRNRNDRTAADITTIRLNGESTGHVFAIRSWSAAIGSNLATIGHPLGNGLSITQGHVMRKGKLSGVPMLAVRLLAAEGGSGSPLLDNNGNVVGILQLGLGGEDALGQRTSGLILGIDLPSWWPNAERNLCRAYPQGGILGCSAPEPPPVPTPTGPVYQIQGCWAQYTAGSWDNVSSAATTNTFEGSDIQTRGAQNFWAVVELPAPPTETISGVTVALIQPDGRTFATSNLDPWQKSYREWSAQFSWTWAADRSLFFQHPEITGQGTWTFRWSFPDGEVCSSPFSVT